MALLRRGLEQLAVGGRLVYSTCALCPLQDEAVVQTALRHYAHDHAATGQQIRLEAMPELDGLGLQDGLRTWQVPPGVPTQYAPDPDSGLDLTLCKRAVPGVGPPPATAGLS